MAQSRKVIVDTNFLTLPQQFKIDIVREIKELVPNAELVTIEQVVKELEKLREGAIGQEMIKRGLIRVEHFESEGTDKALIEYALEQQAMVATNDKELKEQLRKVKVPVIYLRGKKKLDME